RSAPRGRDASSAATASATSTSCWVASCRGCTPATSSPAPSSSTPPRRRCWRRGWGASASWMPPRPSCRTSTRWSSTPRSSSQGIPARLQIDKQ
ncbi:Os10g0529400, partial [Oryza sativa Japonica Group]